MPYDNEYNRMISRDIDYFNRKYVVHSDATGQGTVDYRSQMSDMSRIGGGAGCAEYSMGTAKKGGAILGIQDGTVLGGPRVRTVSHRTEASFSSLGAPLQPPSGVVINSGNVQPYRDLGSMLNKTVAEAKAEVQQKIGAGGKTATEAEAKAYVEKLMKGERKKLTKGLDSELKATAKKEGQSAGKEYGEMYGKQEATSAVNAEVNKVKKGKGRVIGGFGKKKKKAPKVNLFGKKKKAPPPKKKGPTAAQQQQAAAKKKNAEAKKKLAEAKKKNAEAKQKKKDAKKKLESKKKKTLYEKAKGHAGDVAGAYGDALKDIAIRYGTRYMEDMAEGAYNNFIGGPNDSDSEFSDGSSHDGYEGSRRRRNKGERGEHNECPPCKDPYNTLAQGADYEDDGENGGVTKRYSYFSGKTGKGKKTKKSKKSDSEKAEKKERKNKKGAGMITAVNAMNGPAPGPKEKAQMYSSTLSGFGKPKKTNERAVLVKQIMKEKGLSMIEASKFVKENGLY
jgi:hypothetical protein